MSKQTQTTETAKLAKNGLTPALRFPEFSEAGEWEEKRLGEIADFFKGKGISKADIDLQGKTPCIRYGELYTLYGETIYKVYSKTNCPASELFFSHKNDVLLPASGETKIDIATASCVMLDDIALGGDVNIIRLNQNGIFLSYYLNGAKKVDIAKVAQGDSVVHLYTSQLKKIDIALPTLPEQQRIADCLSSLDELITAQGQKLEALKTHKKGLMQGLFPADGETLPALRFPEFQDAGEWGEKRLGEIADPVTLKAKEINNNIILTLSAEHGLVVQSAYFGKKIASENVDRYTKVLIEDFVYNDRATKFNTYGTIKRLSQYQEGVVSPIYKCFRFKKTEEPVFWEWYFESGTHTPELQGLANEGARGGRFNISIQMFLSTFAPRPTLPEQQRIADCLSSLDELISAQGQKLEALKEHKKGLMQGLFPRSEEVRP